MSTGFTFPLQAALQQRTREEQVAQLALARTIGAYGAAIASEDTLQRQRAQSIGAPPGHGAHFDAASRLNTLYYLDRCAAEIRRQHGIVEQWDREVQRARAAVVAASQRRRALERLRERRKRDYELSVRRLLDSQLDELVTLRAGRTGALLEAGGFN